jgi:predicted nucleotidyltransferase
MQLAIIIAEYDPFHCGHMALVRAVRAAGATHVAAIMSGSFLQRGAAACFSKWARTRQALAGGVDLVAELPVPWAVSGAETFARGGVALADALGADMLAFGSECGSADQLQRAAEVLLCPEFGSRLRRLMKDGTPFAVAREAAVTALAGADTAALLRTPNNILGIEYCKAMKIQQSRMQPFTICRQGAEHGSMSESSIPSASRIRTLVQSHGNWADALPEGSAAVVRRELQAGRAPASLDRLERAVLYRLRTMSRAEYASLPDLSEGLENRIFKAAQRACSLEELFRLTKTRRYSLARLHRVVLSAFLGLRAADSTDYPPYLHILGFGPGGRQVLACAAGKGALPLLTHTSDKQRLDSTGQNVLSLERRATNIWALCCPRPCPAGLDETAGILVLEKGECCT